MLGRALIDISVLRGGSEKGSSFSYSSTRTGEAEALNVILGPQGIFGNGPFGSRGMMPSRKGTGSRIDTM
jgi:hypothetical protein